MKNLAVFVSLFTICSISTTAQAGGPTQRQKAKAAVECGALLQKIVLLADAHDSVMKVTQVTGAPKSRLRMEAEANGARFAMVVMNLEDFNRLLDTKEPVIKKIDDLKANLLFDNLNNLSIVEAMAQTHFSNKNLRVVAPNGWRVAWIFDLSLLDRLDITLRPDYPVFQRRPDEKLGDVLSTQVRPRAIVDSESTDVGQIVRLQTTEHRYNPMKLDIEFTDPILLTQAVGLWIPQPLLDYHHVDIMKLKQMPGLPAKMMILNDFAKFPDFKKIQQEKLQ